MMTVLPVAAVMWHDVGAMLVDVLLASLEITGWVILMMTLIELVNVSSSGRLMERFREHPTMQVIIAALLGAIPGCAGGFAVVSMFTHGVITFGAMIAGMVATFGDEAFYLFAQSPKWGFLLTGVLFTIAVVTGWVFTIAGRRWNFALEPHKFMIHADVDEAGHTDHEHETSDHEGHPDKVRHFLREHLWKHVIRQHLLEVFLWSFGVLLFLKGVGLFVNLEILLQDHSWAMILVLLAAVLVGFIPESGPNLIFIVMFLNGSVPFAVLLANSIAQNGHAGLPLLAQSRRNFFILKGITMGLGLLFGIILW